MAALVILTTLPDAKSGVRLARLLVRSKAAACVNVFPVGRSVYRWKGRVEEARESLLMIKASAKKFSRIEMLIRQNHPYELPEVLALPAARGSAAYLRWLHSE